MQLSDHFSLEELTATQVRGLNNTPSAAVVAHLGVVAAAMEIVRARLGHPIIVNSGYRSPEVNRHVGGVENSAHCFGWAVDFICPAFGTPLEVAQAIVDGRPRLNWDQLLREYGWVHLSFDPQMRGDILTKTSTAAPYEKGLVA